MTAPVPSRVAIHLQAGRRIGMGHLLRMLWLARSLRARGLAVDVLLRGDPEAAAWGERLACARARSFG